MAMQADAPCSHNPVISFSDEDYEDTLPYQDNPLVISMVAADYKVERVLVNQGINGALQFFQYTPSYLTYGGCLVKV
ncbi:hypothetical protein CR513_38001, partial [Mucuna pruriens]